VFGDRRPAHHRARPAVHQVSPPRLRPPRTLSQRGRPATSKTAPWTPASSRSPLAKTVCSEPQPARGRSLTKRHHRCGHHVQPRPPRSWSTISATRRVALALRPASTRRRPSQGPNQLPHRHVEGQRVYWMTRSSVLERQVALPQVSSCRCRRAQTNHAFAARLSRDLKIATRGLSGRTPVAGSPRPSSSGTDASISSTRTPVTGPRPQRDCVRTNRRAGLLISGLAPGGWSGRAARRPPRLQQRPSRPGDASPGSARRRPRPPTPAHAERLAAPGRSRPRARPLVGTSLDAFRAPPPRGPASGAASPRPARACSGHRECRPRRCRSTRPPYPRAARTAAMNRQVRRPASRGCGRRSLQQHRRWPSIPRPSRRVEQRPCSTLGMTPRPPGSSDDVPAHVEAGARRRRRTRAAANPLRPQAAAAGSGSLTSLEQRLA